MSEAESGKLYTLTEVSKRTKISMPTLQRYKKLYQARIPSAGSGRSQRYPEEALAVFLQLKKENIGRRGRPRKAGNERAGNERTAKKARATKAPANRGRGKKAVARPAARKSGEKLMTLMEIAERTNISYPTLLRYVKNNLKSIPHKGQGRARRYKPEAVEIFRRLRGESSRGRAAAPAKPTKRRGRPPKKAAAVAAKKPAVRRGRPPKPISDNALAARVNDLEKANKQLVRKLERLEKKLSKPFKVTLPL